MGHLKRLKEFFSDKDNIEVKENLSEIKIFTQGVEADRTRGVVARLSNEFLTNDINKRSSARVCPFVHGLWQIVY